MSHQSVLAYKHDEIAKRQFVYLRIQKIWQTCIWNHSFSFFYSISFFAFFLYHRFLLCSYYKSFGHETLCQFEKCMKFIYSSLHIFVCSYLIQYNIFFWVSYNILHALKHGLQNMNFFCVWTNYTWLLHAKKILRRYVYRFEFYCWDWIYHVGIEFCSLYILTVYTEPRTPTFTFCKTFQSICCAVDYHIWTEKKYALLLKSV